MNTQDQDLQRGYRILFEVFRSVSEDCTEDLERVRREGQSNPMTTDEARDLLNRCFDTTCRRARERGDTATAQHLEERKESIMAKVLAAHASGPAPLTLQAHEGVEPHPVKPLPFFHDRRIAVTEGFLDVRQIQLSPENERLKIHVAQFKEAHGREPSSEDLVSVMSSRANLPGVDAEDEFKIITLARSIAAGGVRTPPIISSRGRLLDGNRRVGACLHVLESDDFTTEEKGRARKIRVWQLTEHATDDDERAVVVTLNFEPDLKVEWPEYVKGQIVYGEWRAILNLEERPSIQRQREIKRELARRFAITTDRVNRYIEMVKLANEFEEHHRNMHKRDVREVQHKTNKFFQYFDELGKGRSPGGVNYELTSDESFKALVFDLLYSGKFRNFSAIRGLKHVARDEEAKDLLREARDTEDLETARERVEDALSAGRAARAVERKLGGNKRIEVFVKWLREVPVEFFSVGDPGAITEKNLWELYRALKLVEGQVPEDWRRAKNDTADVPLVSDQGRKA